MASDATIPGDWENYRPIGAVTRETVAKEEKEEANTNTWRFVAEDGTLAEVALLADDLLRVCLLPNGQQPAQSWAVVRDEWPTFAVRESADATGAFTLTTTAMDVRITTAPFRVTCAWLDGATFAEDDEMLGMDSMAPAQADDLLSSERPAGSVRCYKRLIAGEHILGAGERTAPLDRQGQRIIYWNVDPPQPHGDETRTMYASIPFWLGMRAGRCYGIFFDTVWRSDLDAGATHSAQLSFGADGGDLTYYVFAGPTPAAVLARYADLTGHMPMPPRWALGYGQSRWSYYPEEQVREVAQNFRQRAIPCDSLWLDIDYMDGFRVFTWNARRFPNPARLLSELNAAGYKVVTIIDPGVKADPTDPTYADGVARGYFVRRADGALFTGVVWPGESVFADFSRAEVRAWWGEQHRALLEAGVTAIWDDMNEPALTDRFVPDGGTPRGTTLLLDALHYPNGSENAPLPHRAFHNAYGMQMARATYEGLARLRPNQRPFVLARSGYAGVQRYAALWTGDNQSTWEHLRLASRMCLALGLSGVPFVGFDTGGFWENATGPLLVRFTQLGVVFPFFRNHSALGTVYQEPWAFGQPFEAMCRAAIELRYRLLPYIYTAMAEAAQHGTPVARALAYAYPDDDTLLKVDDEHLFGDDLLCAPVMEDKQPQRLVQFPRGAWINWETGEQIVGPLRQRVDSPLDVLPLFVRQGAVLPLGPVMQYIGELTEEPLRLACYLHEAEGDEATGELYEDDGETPAYQEGNWRRTHFSASQEDNRLLFGAAAPEGAYVSDLREWTIEFHLPYNISAARPTAVSASLDGQAIDVASMTLIARRYETLLCVPLGHVSAPCSLEVELE